MTYNLRTRLGKNKHPIGVKTQLRYIEQLPDIVSLINNRINRTIKMAPAKVTFEHTAYLLRQQKLRVHQHKQNSSVTKKFKTGDVVRIALAKVQFGKGYKPQYTPELYVVRRVVPGNPITYALAVRSTGVRLLGKIYAQELSLFIPSKNKKTVSS